MFSKNLKIKKIFLSSLVLAFFLSSCRGNTPTIDSDSNDSSKSSAIKGEIVIKFTKTVDLNFVKSFAQENNLKLVKFVKGINSAVFQVAGSSSTETILDELKTNSVIDYAEKNYTLKTSYTVNDPRAKEQNGLAVANFPKAWDITFGNKKIIIAVVDTGSDLNHPDLKNKIVSGYNVISQGQTPPLDDNGHGTHASGIATADTNNKIGVAGACPNCRLMPIKALNAKGSGDTVNVAYGIVWAVDHGANVLNLSLGGPENETVKRAVEYALAKNVTVVAAMGNDGKNLRAFPAGIAGVIAVGSIDFERHRSDFSNFGKWISVAAAGSNILSTMPTYESTMTEMEKEKGYDFLDGTSMACPMVAGLAGLILSRYPNYSPRKKKKEKTKKKK